MGGYAFSSSGTFVDAASTFVDDADPTKKLAFQLSGITTATTRTATWQDVSGTIYVSGGTDVALADGGLNASLVASVGGIFYSTASAGAILAGTATAAQMLQSGASAAPTWSTSTWPATTTISQLLYSSAANTVAGLATANSGVLVTSAGGVPSIATDIPTAVTIGAAYVYRAAGTDVPITDGGTGASTLPTGVLIGAGTGAITALTNTPWATFAPTVTLVGGAGNTAPVYSTNTGRYRQIGDLVFVDIYLTGDGGAEGAGTGTFNIALPVTAGASTPTEITPMGFMVNGATSYNTFGQIAPSATTVLLVLQTLVTTFGTMTGADQNSTTRTVRLKFFYEA